MGSERHHPRFIFSPMVCANIYCFVMEYVLLHSDVNGNIHSQHFHVSSTQDGPLSRCVPPLHRAYKTFGKPTDVL